ncbi:MAG: hypothetical protein IPK82_21240 [Polyangiaceae bacterium]|nr:hypothetical protein [Polyangiaceae bacterium]
MKLRPVVFLTAATVTMAPMFLAGCPADGMTAAEAGKALEEIAIEAQASALTNGTIEISTNFTIGDAVEAAAEELKTFVESQLPCAEIVLQANTLTVEYGAKPGNCTYKGQTYSGIHSITVTKNNEGEVVVDHVWKNRKNQTVGVTGTATVTWNLKDPSRHVVHELNWTRLSDGRTGKGTGDELQKPLSGGLIEGFSVDGERGWEGEEGDWELAINNVEVRWQDPIPQAGSYEVVAPNGKTATLSFTRVDEDSIEAKFVTGKNEWVFVVNKLGMIEDQNGGKN